MSDAYEIVSFRGGRFDRMTAQALSRMEEKLGYDLSIMQGSYNSGVGASAGTHDGGGAVDLAAYDHKRKVRAGREVGFAMWYRSSAEGPWSPHCHGILVGNAKLSSGAATQVTAYRNGRNGLASNAADTFGWRPSPIPSYKFAPEKKYSIDLHNVRVDFLDVLDGGTNKSTRRGRVIQKCLNSKLKSDIVVDGVIGEQTVEAWRRWERKIGVTGRPGVPDRASLRALFKWTIYYISKK